MTLYVGPRSRVPTDTAFLFIGKVPGNVRQASAHNIHRLVQRLQRLQRWPALQTLARLDPKSIERSTIIGISLFAASSIALQGLVVAQGNLSGKSTGVAQAAIALPKINNSSSQTQRTDALDLRQRIDSSAGPAARRGDRLNQASLGLISEANGVLRIASLVPADTIIPKPVSAIDHGLRSSTFAPSRILGRNNTDGLTLSTRGMQKVDADLPRPTRVTFAGAASSLGHEVRRDTGEVVEIAPRKTTVSSVKLLGRRGGARRDIIEKVHFQDDTPDRCLPTELMNVIYDVAERFGDVQILSTFRDPERNRRVGGAQRSFHLRCQAIDFRVMQPQPNREGLLKYLEDREDVGGLKRYPLGFFHIDTGPRRTW